MSEWTEDAQGYEDDNAAHSKDDESTAYLEFLNDEVSNLQYGVHPMILTKFQAQKFSRAVDEDDEDDLGEDSVLLESPLDKIEPYQLFRATLMSKPATLPHISVRPNPVMAEMQQEQPQYYTTLAGTLSADDQGTIQNVMVKADEIANQQALQAQMLAQQQGGTTPTPGSINGGAS